MPATGVPPLDTTPAPTLTRTDCSFDHRLSSPKGTQYWCHTQPSVQHRCCCMPPTSCLLPAPLLRCDARTTPNPMVCTPFCLLDMLPLLQPPLTLQSYACNLAENIGMAALASSSQPAGACISHPVSATSGGGRPSRPCSG